MKLNQKQLGQLRGMNDRCVYYRGVYIHLATRVESMVNKFLADYFCPNDTVKKKEIFYGLFSSERMLMGHKVQLLQFLVALHYPVFHKRYNIDPVTEYNKLPSKKKGDIPKPATFNSRLDEMVSVRNKFAHRTFLQTEDDINNFDGINISLDARAINLKDFTWKNSPLTLTEAEIKRYQDNLSLVLVCFSDLDEAVNAKETP